MKKWNRFIIAIIGVLPLIGCDVRTPPVIAFESALPNTDLRLLEKLVASYDEMIVAKFDGDPTVFIDAIQNDESIFDKHDRGYLCELINLIDASTLNFRTERMSYDTVFLSGNGTVVARTADFSPDDDMNFMEEEIIILRSGESDTAQFERIVNEGYQKFVSESSVIVGFRSIAHLNKEVEQYLKRRRDAATSNVRIKAKSISGMLVDTEDYFIKRIIVFELYIGQIRKELEC